MTKKTETTNDTTSAPTETSAPAKPEHRTIAGPTYTSALASAIETQGKVEVGSVTRVGATAPSAPAGKYRVKHGRVRLGHDPDTQEIVDVFPGGIVTLSAAEASRMLHEGSVERIDATPPPAPAPAPAPELVAR